MVQRGRKATLAPRRQSQTPVPIQADDQPSPLPRPTVKRNAEAIADLSTKTGKIDNKLDDIMKILQADAVQKKTAHQAQTPPPSQQCQVGADAAPPSQHITRTGADSLGAASANPPGSRIPSAASFSVSPLVTREAECNTIITRTTPPAPPRPAHPCCRPWVAA